ncbi:MAG: ArsC family reductase [Gammaproteobacteria bacterium]|nr:ArsC family reductase [Gammaproteobacteria bacterium]
MLKIYGIPNCDTVKKARAWLETNGVEYQFHDFKKDGLSEAQLEKWLKIIGWQILLNKRGTTYRQLPDKEKLALNEDKVKKLMLIQPALIKRPVVETDKTTFVGFNEADFKAINK